MGRVLWPLGLMGALGLAIGISARSCGQPAPAMAPAPLRSEPPPDLASAPPPDFVGVLVLGYAVDVTPRLEGKVEAVFVHPGDRVKAGTPLAHVDLAKTREELEMARAELLALRAEELDSAHKLRRRIPLGGGAISREEVDSARALAQAAHAKVLAQRARIEQLTLVVDEAQLRAPFDGVVAARYVDPGAVAGPGKPVARLVGAGGEPQVRFAVPEEYARELAVGRRIVVVAPSLPQPIVGQIVSLSPEVASGSRFVFARGRIELGAEQQAQLSSGIVVRVALVKNGT